VNREPSIELEMDSYEQSKESAASTPFHEKCIADDSMRDINYFVLMKMIT